MEIKSVNNSKQPNYPTIELFVKSPELLARNIPNSWLKNKFVATSLAAFLLSGCGTNTTKNSEEIVSVDTLKSNNPNEDTIKSAVTAQELTNIAPVFAHGEGVGAIGCVVTSPPVFLSENEAMKIILDKLRAEGYRFNRKNCPTFSFEVLPIANCYELPKVDQNGDTINSDKPKGNAKIELKMDAYNSKSKWAIQFISPDDNDKFKNDNCYSSVSFYHTKQAAEIINQELKKKQEINAVVFYDPLTRIKPKDWDNFEKNKEISKNESRDSLLAQVNDFINWLKANNITIK